MAAGSNWNVNAGGSVAGGAVTLFVGSGTGTSGAFSVNSTTGTATFAGLNAGNTFNGGTTAGDSTGTVSVTNGAALTPVPEPSTWALLAGGFGSLLAMTVGRRCRK